MLEATPLQLAVLHLTCPAPDRINSSSKQGGLGHRALNALHCVQLTLFARPSSFPIKGLALLYDSSADQTGGPSAGPGRIWPQPSKPQLPCELPIRQPAASLACTGPSAEDPRVRPWPPPSLTAVHALQLTACCLPCLQSSQWTQPPKLFRQRRQTSTGSPWSRLRPRKLVNLHLNCQQPLFQRGAASPAQPEGEDSEEGWASSLRSLVQQVVPFKSDFAAGGRKMGLRSRARRTQLQEVRMHCTCLRARQRGL